MAGMEGEVVAEIRRILGEELEWKGAVEPSHDLLKDLQLDSLGLTVLAVGLENRFRVKLSEEDSVGIVTVADLARLVSTRVAATPGERR
ncbi:MAG: acyl carrier protein [Hyalangium sp.]|uniref:acyl carrier protein n=1 Tax=Hyalangium sp. TaxID=2028555 RepID=UPI00389B319D